MQPKTSQNTRKTNKAGDKDWAGTCMGELPTGLGRSLDDRKIRTRADWDLSFRFGNQLGGRVCRSFPHANTEVYRVRSSNAAVTGMKSLLRNYWTDESPC
jgi:hypothetical protein